MTSRYDRIIFLDNNSAQFHHKRLVHKVLGCHDIQYNDTQQTIIIIAFSIKIHSAIMMSLVMKSVSFFYLLICRMLLCWMSLCCMSLCWMSWGQLTHKFQIAQCHFNRKFSIFILIGKKLIVFNHQCKHNFRYK